MHRKYTKHQQQQRAAGSFMPLRSSRELVQTRLFRCSLSLARRARSCKHTHVYTISDRFYVCVHCVQQRWRRIGRNYPVYTSGKRLNFPDCYEVTLPIDIPSREPTQSRIGITVRAMAVFRRSIPVWKCKSPLERRKSSARRKTAPIRKA